MYGLKAAVASFVLMGLLAAPLAQYVQHLSATDRMVLRQKAAALLGIQPEIPVITKAAPDPIGQTDEETIEPDRLGQFFTEVRIQGIQLHAMVDTGASFVLLSDEDAGRLGLRPPAAQYTYKASTANGISTIALIMIPEIRLGHIVIRDVPAAVAARGAITGDSLLGMSFLKKLRGFRIEAGRLKLRQ